MESRFFKQRSVNATVESRLESISELPSQPSTSAANFATGLRQILGEEAEPDALFFVESWTLSVPQAIENLRLRQSEKQPHAGAPGALHNDPLGSAAYVQQTQWRIQQRMQPVQQTCATAMAGFAVMDAPVSQTTSLRPDHKARQDRSDAGNPDVNPRDEMTAQRAWTLLGVAANSTRAQMRSAYRRMVSRWHPDRHEHSSEEARLAANQKMAAINEAYRLLRDARLLKTTEAR